MSSRELLVLIDKMPEDSEYKRARAGYPYKVDRDWTHAEYLQARLVAEVAVQGGGDFDPTGLVGPVEQAISDMKARGEWPPAWWPEEETPVAPHIDLRAVSDLIANQLHGRS